MKARRQALFVLSFLLAARLLAGEAQSQPVVRGKVTSSQGAPLAGARVLLLPVLDSYSWGRMAASGRAYPEPAVTSLADSSGHFRLSPPDSGLWHVVVEAAGFVPIQTPVLALLDSTDLPLAIPPPDQGLSVRLRSLPGQTLEDVWVYAASDTPSAWQRTTTHGWKVRPRLARPRADGSLYLPLASGEALQITVAAGGQTLAQSTASADTTLRLPKRWPNQLDLLIVDHEGRSAPAVQVRSKDYPVPLGESDPQGRMVVRAPPDRAVGLRLLSADGRRRTGTLSPATDRGPVQAMTLALPPPGFAAGRVIDARARSPLAGALVWLPQDPGAFVRTNSEGRYELPVIDADPAKIEAEASGYLPLLHRFERSPGSSRSPTLALDPATLVSGRVVDGEGKPVAGAHLEAVRRSAMSPRRFSRSGFPRRNSRSADDGSFRISKLLAGETWELRVSRDGFAPYRSSFPLLFPGLHDLRISLERGTVVFGQVVDSEERPLPEIVIRMSLPGQPSLRSAGGQSKEFGTWLATTDGNGRFEIGPLPRGQIDLQAEGRGFAPLEIPAIEIPSAAAPFDLGSIVLEHGALLDGLVVDPSDRPVERAALYLSEDPLRLLLRAEAGHTSQPIAAITGPDGRFRLENLRRGTEVGLLVRAEGFLPAALAAIQTPSSTPLRLVLEPGVRVAGRVVDSKQEPVSGARVEARAAQPRSADRSHSRRSSRGRSTFTADDGSFVLEGTRPGRVLLEVVASGFSATTEPDFEIPEGGLDGLIFTLQRGAVVSGQVLTSEGGPVEDSLVTYGLASSVADADGYYRLTGLPIGKGRIRTAHASFPSLEKSIEISTDEMFLDLVLPRSHEVAGRVVDAAGEGAAGATLTLVCSHSFREQQTLGHRDGSFLFPTVADGRYLVQAAAPGRAPTTREITVSGKAIHDLEIVIEEGGSIAGWIVGLDLYDLAAVGLVVRSRDGSQSHQVPVSYQGRFQIESLPAGDWQVVASLEGAKREARRRVTVVGSEQTEVTLEFGEGLTLTGTVTSRGQPLPEAQVSLRGLAHSALRQVTTSHAGDLRIEDLEPGPYELQVLHTGSGINHLEQLELESSRTVLIEIESYRVSGTVLEEATSKALPGALLELRRIKNGEIVYLVTEGTDGEGAFDFPNISAGIYQLQVGLEGFAPFEMTLAVEATTANEDLQIHLQSAAGFAFDVRRASGPPPDHVVVALFGSSGNLALFEVRPVDESGRVRVPSAPPGAWSLLLSAPRAALTRSVVEIPGPTPAIMLPNAGILTLRAPALTSTDLISSVTLTSPDGIPLHHLDAQGFLRSHWSMHGGHAILEGIPQGSWALDIQTPGERPWSSIVVTDGGDLEATLE